VRPRHVEDTGWRCLKISRWSSGGKARIWERVDIVAGIASVIIILAADHI
jgi:hypothetical protein